jgi:hypothetical protein
VKSHKDKVNVSCSPQLITIIVQTTFTDHIYHAHYITMPRIKRESRHGRKALIDAKRKQNTIWLDKADRGEANQGKAYSKTHANTMIRPNLLYKEPTREENYICR